MYTSLEIKSCPFCGGKAKIKQTAKYQLQLRCTSCVIGISQRTLRHDLEWLETQIINAWNQRVNP